MNKLFFIAFICFIYTSGFAQKNDSKLTGLIQNEIKNFKGDIGVYVYHLKKNKFAAVNADSIFPTASIIKVPILAGVFQKIATGELKLSQEFYYDTARLYGGSGLMQYFKDSTRIDLSTMISLMITYSDNIASLWLQELCGGGKAINALMEQVGLQSTKVNSRTKGREQWRQVYGWGQTTPKEMAHLLKLIAQGKLIDARHSQKMFRYMKNQYYDNRSLSQLPPTVTTISKPGMVDDARGEVVLAHAPGGDFVFCILTKNNTDQSWTPQNEAEVLTRKLANLIWNYFEPKHPYTAAMPIE